MTSSTKREIDSTNLNIHEHGNVDEESQERDGSDVHGQMFPPWRDSEMNPDKERNKNTF